MRSIFKLLALLPAVLAAPVQERPAAESGELIPNQWIVKIPSSSTVDNVVSSILGILKVDEMDLLARYDLGDFKGFAFKADVPGPLVKLIGALAGVDAIEQDAVFHASALTRQSPVPSYGLARISSRNRGASDYIFDDSAGAGTFSYIIDTGIYTQHQDFGGRATFGANFAGDGFNGDGNGHGTHVAGTVGGSQFGVAKRTNLIAVKVLNSNGQGSTSGIVNGIQWTVNDARQRGRIGRAVANLSLGGGFSSILNQAAREAVSAGLFLAVAAGNENQDARNVSPASESSVCTIGAIDSRDNRASYSNFGPAVDLFAPGTDITSAWIRSSTDTNTISGTSMASPHVAGLGAYILAIEGQYSGTGLCNRIIQLSTTNVVTNTNGAPNRLAYNGNGRR